MISLNNWDNRYVYATFDIGGEYITVLSNNIPFEECMEEFLYRGANRAARPVIIISVANLTRSQFEYLDSKDIADYTFGV